MAEQQQLEMNKNNVMAFYDPMFNLNNPSDAIKGYVVEVYIQHNPAVADGKTLSLSILREWQKSTGVRVFTSSEP
ncbi:MAG TPA: hypothetical protein VI037_06290 [Nitrososphaera sp.]